MINKIRAIGIILVFLMIGLSGCNELGGGVTNIGDLSANPESYIGKVVTIEGQCISGIITDNSGHVFWYRSGQQLMGRYRITGNVEYGELYYGTGKTYYINVSSSKAL